MNKLSNEAKGRLLVDRDEFINVLGSMRGKNIYEAGFTIAVHSKVFDMIYNDEITNDRLTELVMKHDSPIVNIISGEYVIQKYTDFNDLRNFVENKIQAMINAM